MAATLVTGCIMTAGQSFQKYGASRAAFDLKCSVPELKLVAVSGSLDDLAAAGNQIGVTGCGKQAVYVNTEGGGWVLNGVAP